jgi:hypothetical protein
MDGHHIEGARCPLIVKMALSRTKEDDYEAPCTKNIKKASCENNVSMPKTAFDGCAHGSISSHNKFLLPPSNVTFTPTPLLEWKVCAAASSTTTEYYSVHNIVVKLDHHPLNDDMALLWNIYSKYGEILSTQIGSPEHCASVGAVGLVLIQMKINLPALTTVIARGAVPYNDGPLLIHLI